MHQQLGDLTPVRAVLALGGLELYGPHDVAFSLREEQNYPVSRDPAHQSRAASTARGARKPSDAPWATQETSSAVSSSSSLDESRFTRRIDSSGSGGALSTPTTRVITVAIRHAGADGAETEDRQVIDSRRKAVAGADAVPQRID